MAIDHDALEREAPGAAEEGVEGGTLRFGMRMHVLDRVHLLWWTPTLEEVEQIQLLKEAVDVPSR